ncbi:putative reverse transcriptase domain-containing protein [Tanacetum coccineum]
MEEIKTASAGAYQYLVDKDPCTWSRAYFKEGMDCDAVENGLSESFNSRIKDARRKPISGMLEDIRSYVMTRNYTLRKECKDWKSDICPNIRKVLELHKKIQRKWSLSPSGWHQFEVRQGNGEAFCVDLEKRKCSCRQWQLIGVPCPHSITAMYFINTNPDDYVSDSFKRKIKHVPCKPPLERRMPGRPPVNRKKDKSEMKNQKHVARPPRSMTCKNCGETGHNKNDCEKPKVPGEQANPPNEQPNRASQQVSSRSRDKFVTTRGGIWMGGTSASGQTGEGGVLVVQTREGEVLVEKYILLDEDDLVDVQVEEEVNTRDENVAAAYAYENVVAGVAEQDENQDEAARLKRNCEELCESQDKAG